MTRLRPSAAILFLVFVAATTPTYADIPVSFYKKLHNVSDIAGFKDYITGLGRGVFWSNTVLEHDGKPKIFCMPGNLHLDEGIILSLLDQEIRTPSNGVDWKPNIPIELIMVAAFRNKFPCDKSRP